MPEADKQELAAKLIKLEDTERVIEVLVSALAKSHGLSVAMLLGRPFSAFYECYSDRLACVYARRFTREQIQDAISWLTSASGVVFRASAEDMQLEGKHIADAILAESWDG